MTIPSTFFHLTALGIGGLSPGLKWSRPGGIIDTHLRDRADYRDTHSSVSCRGLCVLFYNLIKYLIAGPGQISWCHVKSQWSPGDKIFIAGLRLSCHINTIQIQSCSSCSIIWIEGTSILWTRGDIQTVNLWNTNSSLFRLELQNKWLLISMYIHIFFSIFQQFTEIITLKSHLSYETSLIMLVILQVWKVKVSCCSVTELSILFYCTSVLLREHE